MRTHIKLVGMIQIVSGLLSLLMALGILIGGVFGGMAMAGVPGLLVGGAVGGGIAIVIALFAVFEIVAGVSLMRYRSWARYAVIVLSAINLFRWWIGTVIGAYSLWVLFQSESAAIFGDGDLLR